MLEIRIVIITLIQWAAFLIFGVFTLMLILESIFRIHITEEEVYDTLSYPNWKSYMQIKEDLRKLKNIKEERIVADIKSPHLHLLRLVENGFIDHQRREVDNADISKDKIPVHEYRRTGKKREKKQPLLDTLLEPTKS
jgi:hypothetical protein